MKTLSLVSALILLCACTVNSKSNNPVLDITGGKIQGIINDSGNVLIYKGVPYAAPPTGAFRWKKPQPVIPWDDIRIADTFSKASVQEDHAPDFFYTKEFYWEGDPEWSEDCLYLNVWTPVQAAGNPEKKLPVALWIHGGAYRAGWGHEVTMDGEAWADKGVILVTFNYRLGLLGFLTHPLLAAEDPNGVSGNYGTYDQVAALEWVKNNIAAFGGDPSNITVFGQSAGAASVQNMVISPLSKPMVNKAIIQSGGGLGVFMPEATYADVEQTGKEIMDRAGYDTLEKMRAATPAELEEAAAAYGRASGRYMMMFAPVKDGYLLTESFTEAVYNNTVADVPYMIGYNTDDFVDMGPSIDRFCAVRDSLSNHPAYSYLFARGLPGDDSGAFHSAELWYVFNTLSRSWRPFTEADHTLADEMVTCWTNFAKYGNPNGQTPGPWKPSTQNDPYTMLFQIK